MIERGWLGEKRGQGFYKRVGKGRRSTRSTWKTLEYHPPQKPKLPVGGSGAQHRGPARSACAPWSPATTAPARSCGGCSATSSSTRAAMVPEISDRIVEIDRAMRWGYAHTLGPFELWDALGRGGDRAPHGGGGPRACRTTSARCWLRGARVVLPARRTGTAQPAHRVLRSRAARLRATWSRAPASLVLDEIKRARGVVKKNAGASLIDLGDGVLCLEFHSKMNALGDDAGRHDLRRHRGDRAQLPGAGDRQRGRELQRRRQSDAGAAGRAGRRVGRAERRRPRASSRPTWPSSTRPRRWWRRRSA